MTSFLFARDRNDFAGSYGPSSLAVHTKSTRVAIVTVTPPRPGATLNLD
jgi:hypothetical protein